MFLLFDSLIVHPEVNKFALLFVIQARELKEKNLIREEKQIEIYLRISDKYVETSS